MYVYIQSEPSLWTVGHYDPSGDWHPESDHSSPEGAAKRVNWLNGANDVKIKELELRIEEIEMSQDSRRRSMLV